MTDAFITELERGSTVDGPGIRTVVFLKGCPLHCAWCHNPETIRREPEIMRDLKRCTNCGHCLSFPAEKIDDAIRDCPANAAKRVGCVLSLPDFLKSVKTDAKFLIGGGVTFSGGEPLLQYEWVASAAKACHNLGIHTALDTTLCVSWECVEKVLPHIDLFMVDVKHPDSALHRKYTGMPNDIILQNLRKLDTTGKDILLRTPLIPGVNDSPECVADLLLIGETLRNLIRWEFLQYNPLTSFKYERLGREYKLQIGKATDLFELKKLLDGFHIPAVIIQ